MHVLRRAYVFISIIILCLWITSCGDTQASTSSTNTTHLANKTPTSTAITKPTISVQSLTLGGRLNFFESKYGPQDRGRYNSAMYNNTLYQLSLLVMTDGQPGEQDDSHDRVISIDASPLGDNQNWDMKAAQHICGAFMPPDSKHAKDVNGPTIGEVLHEYYSQLLANTLPSSDFVISSLDDNLNGQSVKPGLFTVIYNNFVTLSSDQVAECGLGVGIDYLAVG